MEQRILSILKKRKYVMAVVVIILVSSTAALTWMWLSNTIVDDVEVTDQPMTLTLLESPTSIWKGTWPYGPIYTWTFNLSIDYGVMTMCDFHMMVSWDGYNSSEAMDYDISQRFNSTDIGWGGMILVKPDCLDMSSNIRGPDDDWFYQWQAGDSMWFTFDIIIDTSMPVGNYHFEFAVSGRLV